MEKNATSLSAPSACYRQRRGQHSSVSKADFRQPEHQSNCLVQFLKVASGYSTCWVTAQKKDAQESLEKKVIHTEQRSQK